MKKDFIFSEISKIKVVGPQLTKYLKKKRIEKIKDIILNLHYSETDRSKIINLNNGYLGMVRQWQEFFYEKRYAMSYMDALPDFVKLAESYGHLGIKVEKEEDLKPALIEAFKQKDRTVFIDIMTDPSENVFPMIPAGGAHCDMLLAGRDEMVSKDETDFNAV